MLTRAIVNSWSDCIRRAIVLGEGDAAYKITVNFVHRLKELGLLS
jgi:hypothetical protein